MPRDPDVVQKDVRCVRGAQAELLDGAARLGPFVAGGTMNAACPRAPSAGSTEATTTWIPAIPPLVIHAFWPESTHSSAASS